VLVNKADGELEAHAERTAAEYANALRLLRPRSPNWQVPVRTCSALTGVGVAEAWSLVEQYRRALGDSGELAARRAGQARTWLWDAVSTALVEALTSDDTVSKQLPEIEQRVSDGTLTPAAAARTLVESFVEGRARNASSAPPGAKKRAGR
jgi:LAO/AO transport system kinase